MDLSPLEFRRFMLCLANELTESDRENLEYYLGEVIPAGKREALRKRSSVSSLFEELHRTGHIGLQNLGFLKKSLKAIFREDLADEVGKLDCYNSESANLRLRPKRVNYCKSSGYYLSISGGKHLVSDEGDDYVYVQSGTNYQLVIFNSNNNRVKCEIKCDGHIIMPEFIMDAKEEKSLNRSCHTPGKLKFFAIKDAPADSGIDARNTDENGVIQVTFIPEILAMTPRPVKRHSGNGMEMSQMTISCNIGEGRFIFVTCSTNTTDVEFHSLISRELNLHHVSATILIDGWKPLGKRNAQLVDYDIKDWSHVLVNFGFVGGVMLPPSLADGCDDEEDLESVEWIPGATTMQGRSEQTFVKSNNFVPNQETRKVVLHLRLVARADDTPVASNGRCIPFVLGNRHPPPV